MGSSSPPHRFVSPASFRPKGGRSKRLHGFTLIELLVVISIVALLVALLLPVLKGARERAQSVVCRSNMRQLGQLIHTYTNDNDGMMPAYPSNFNSDCADDLNGYGRCYGERIQGTTDWCGKMIENWAILLQDKYLASRDMTKKDNDPRELLPGFAGVIYPEDITDSIFICPSAGEKAFLNSSEPYVQNYLGSSHFSTYAANYSWADTYHTDRPPCWKRISHIRRTDYPLLLEEGWEDGKNTFTYQSDQRDLWYLGDSTFPGFWHGADSPVPPAGGQSHVLQLDGAVVGKNRHWEVPTNSSPANGDPYLFRLR